MDEKCIKIMEINPQMVLADFAIWGTGCCAQDFLLLFGIFRDMMRPYGYDSDAECFYDNDIRKNDMIFCGKVVKIPEQLKIAQRSFLVIAVRKYDAIIEQLEGIGLRENIDFVTYREYFSLIITRVIKDESRRDEIRRALIEEGSTERMKDLLPALYYDIGRSDILQYKKNSSILSLRNGMDYLSQALSMRYRETEIEVFLFEKIFLMQEDMQRAQYEANRAILSGINEKKLLADFDDLPITVFENQGQQWIYDKKNRQIFWDRKYHGTWDAYCKLILGKTDKKVDQYLRTQQYKRLAQDIFLSLQKELDQKICRKYFYREIRAYRRLLPNSEKYFLLIGRYYYLKKMHHRALFFALQGQQRRRLDPTLCSLLGKIYFSLKNYKLAARYIIFSSIKNGSCPGGIGAEDNHINNVSLTEKDEKRLQRCVKMALKRSPAFIDEILDEISTTSMHARKFPTPFSYYLDENGMLQKKEYFEAGKAVQCLSKNIPYTVGFYRSSCFLNYSQWMPWACKGKKENYTCFDTTVFDILKGKADLHFSYTMENRAAAILSIMPTKKNQLFKICYGGQCAEYKDDPMIYPRFEELKCNYLRISKDCTISSDEAFLAGTPIPIGTARKKRRVVINIWPDGLAFKNMRNDLHSFMPNVEHFFSKGVIFSHAYSPGEWTLASAPSIFSGIYQDKTQIFHSTANVDLASQYETIGEVMNGLGYYCINFSPLSAEFFNCGMYCGFDRSIGSRDTEIEFYMMKILGLLQQMKESALFINLHFLEIHDAASWQKSSFSSLLKIDLEDILLNDANRLLVKSSNIPFSQSRNNIYEAEIRRIDGLLGALFSYLEGNLQDDEYIVTFQSDHGMSIVGEEDFMLKEGRVSVPLMARGCGVPQLGVVRDEVVSEVDLYSILTHLCGYKVRDGLDCRLPRAFGGKGREYAIAQSLYPGQTFKLAVHTLTHEFWLETESLTTNDGKINMDNFHYKIFDKHEPRSEIVDETLAEWFIGIAREHTKYLDEYDYD